MIQKNGDTLYLFDFDGTICGENKWTGLFHNSTQCFKKCLFNPEIKDIRWSILTGRPKIDKLFVKMVCRFHGMQPDDIITGSTWLYSYKSEIANYQAKCNSIKNILDGYLKLKSITYKINKVFYIDNDIKCTKYLNSHNGEYRYLAMGVNDLITKNLTSVLL